MRMYDLFIMMPTWKKEVIIQFGFCEVNPKEVEQWIYQKYPNDYKELKQGLAQYNRTFGKSNVVPLIRETMTKEERSTLLDTMFENEEFVLSNIKNEVDNIERS